MRLLKSNSCDQLELIEDTLAQLSKVPAPIVVVGVAGLYRTGKSYLLNLLAGETRGWLRLNLRMATGVVSVPYYICPIFVHNDLVCITLVLNIYKSYC